MDSPSRSSGTAVASLVFGILCWFVLPFLGAILAIVFGHSARGEIRRAPAGAIEGDGMALAGLILGYAHLAIAALVVLLVFLVPVLFLGILGSH